MAVVVVLGLLSITIAVCYAMLRTQSYTAQIQTNASRQADARQAAVAGLTIAIRKMHQADWPGVDTVLRGDLQAHTSYEAHYQTGDPSLSPGDDDYAEYPFRVAVRSTGYVQDPANPSVRAVHTVRAVMQLNRRARAATPANWARLQEYDADHPYTVVQWGDVPARIQSPVRIEGPCHFQGSLNICDEYPRVDNRPLDGQLDEVAVFETALEENALLAIYQAGIIGLSGRHDEAGGGIDWDISWKTLSRLYGNLAPESWWRLHEPDGDETADAQGRHAGTCAGARLGAAGINGAFGNRAATFDGYNDYISVGKFDLSGQSLTLLAWFKIDSFARESDQRFISKADGYDEDDHYWMLGTCRKGNKHTLRFRLRTSSGVKTLEASAGEIATGVWNCAAAVYDGNKMRLYLNGEQVGDSGKSGAIAGDPNVNVWLGDNPPGSAQARYLRDLKKQADESPASDYRPLTGPLYHPRTQSSELNVSLCEDDLGVAVNDVSQDTSSPVSHPGTLVTYRLYPGGKEYEIPQLSYSVSHEAYGPDSAANPLGLFRTWGDLTLWDNVTVEGVIITEGSDADLFVKGDNVVLSAPAMPPIEGEDGRVELPCVLAKDDVWIDDAANHRITGLVFSQDDFQVFSGGGDATLALRGRIVARQFEVNERYGWTNSISWWREKLRGFLVQESPDSEDGARRFFPVWLAGDAGLDPQPKLQIKPRSENVSYHYQDFAQPIYQPHPDDEGLVWDLMDWTDED